MRRDQIDPAQLNGEDLERWYRRTGRQLEAEREGFREDQYRAFFGDQSREDPERREASDTYTSDDLSGWTEARVMARPPAPVVAPSVSPAAEGARIAAPPPVAGVPDAVPRGGFFDTYRAIPNPVLGPIYITGLPSPLNSVTPKVGGWFQLGDGTLVRGVGELESVYAEQQRRMWGQEDVEAPARVQAADRYKDGVIPQASQVPKGQRENDATCHPNGGWERDPTFSSYRERSRDYESQVTRAPGLYYVVRNPSERPVRFDGCAVWDPRHQLLEAKGPGYESLDRQAGKSTFQEIFRNGLRKQAARQQSSAGDKAIEWHVAEPGALSLFDLVTSPYPSIQVVETPPR